MTQFLGDIKPGFYRLLHGTDQFSRKHQPFSDLLFPLVRKSLNVSLADANYAETFDFFEYLLALLYVDGELLKGRDRPSWAPAGSFVWRDRYLEHADISRKVQRQPAELVGNGQHCRLASSVATSLVLNGRTSYSRLFLRTTADRLISSFAPTQTKQRTGA